MRILVKGGRVLRATGDLHRPAVSDILIETGRIVAVEPDGAVGDENARVVDARERLVVPGFVNAHYHSHDVLLRGMFEQLPLEIWGLLSFPSSYPRRSDEEVATRTLLGAAENLLAGTTTVQDMASLVGADEAHLEALRSAYEGSGIRAVVALQYGDRAAVDTVPFWREELAPDVQAQLGPAVDPAPMQRMVDRLLDAHAPDRLTWALGPSAPQRCSANLLRWTARTAEEQGVRVFTHLYETRSQAILARREYRDHESSLVSYLDKMGLLSPRLTIAHGVWTSDSEIGRLASEGAHLVCNPISNLKLLNGFAPVRRYAEAGVPIGLGCDNCSGNDAQDMFASMKAFALWWANAGEAGEQGAAERAFGAATSGGAAALGLGDHIGRIEPGYRADLTLLRLDDPAFVPLNSAVRQLVYAATPRAVDTVIVDGRTVVRDGRLVDLDLARAQAAAHRLRPELCACVDDIAARWAPAMPELLRVQRRFSCEPLPMDRLCLR